MYYDDCVYGEYVYGDDVYLDDYYMDEQWKRIRGFPCYWISTKARVYSEISGSFVDGSIMRSGYVDISLHQGGKRYHRYLHRLVAEEFIPNPHNYPVVRHLDDDPLNNEINNLAWGTPFDNVQDCIKSGHFRYFTDEDIERANAVRRTPIIAIRLRDGKTMRFISQQEASRTLDIRQSDIASVLTRKIRAIYGWYFVYEKDYDPSFDHANYRYQVKRKPVRAYSPSTGREMIFGSARQAAEGLNMSETSISYVLTGKSKFAKGWRFEYIDEDGVYD